MADWLIESILADGHWLALAMVVGAGAVALRVFRRPGVGQRPANVALDTFYGCMIGVMASGHLLAVTVKMLLGSLEGSPWLLYPLGLVLLVPSIGLVAGAAGDGQSLALWRRPVALNLWLGISLLAMGLHNWILAAPAALNLAYRFSPRPGVARAVLVAILVGYTALFVGSLVFLASGQSFEQFRGIEP